MADRYPDERFVGVEIHPDLLRTEADRLDATPATGPASWALGEAAALLRLAADTWATEAVAGTASPAQRAAGGGETIPTQPEP